MDERLLRFFQWNDLHIRDRDIPGRGEGYPECNEKAAWAVACANGESTCERPDFVASVGDIICRGGDDFRADFHFLERHILQQLTVPLLPCLGNHENRQGEGVTDLNDAYDALYGPAWHNYIYTAAGLAFIVVDTSGAHRQPDEITAGRNAFVERAFDRIGPTPALVLTHVPLIAMRDEAAMLPSFGFSSWKVLDEGMLAIVEERADQVIAVLCGHIHLTAMKVQRGIHHIMPSGTAGYPADFAAFDVYADRIDVEMLRAPDDLIGDPSRGDIHGAKRHGIDYVDTAHPVHDCYMSGNADERTFSIPLEGGRRPNPRAGREGVIVQHESAPGQWLEVELVR